MKIKLLATGTIIEAENPLVAFLAYLQGDAELIGDQVIISMIEEELSKYRPKLSPEELAKIRSHKNTETWDNLRDKIKPVIIQLWQKTGYTQGYLEIGEMRDAILKHPEFKEYDPETVSRRIRELADTDIEKPPYLLHYGDTRGSGRYVLNGEAMMRRAR